MKRGRSSHLSSASFNKPKDQTFSASRKDSELTSFKREGFSKPTTSMASSGSSRMVKSEGEFCARNHGGECRK